jgi:SulP family sulfate permease
VAGAAGSLSRTSLARTAGGTSQLAHAVTGAAVLAFLPAGAPLLSALPRAVLGGLVAVAMLPLMRPAAAMLPSSMRRQQQAAASSSSSALRDFALGWATAAATIVAAPRLERGLLVGLALAAVLAAWRAAGERIAPRVSSSSEMAAAS